MIYDDSLAVSATTLAASGGESYTCSKNKISQQDSGTTLLHPFSLRSAPL